jgi:hypothetical protein
MNTAQTNRRFNLGGLLSTSTLLLGRGLLLRVKRA